METAKVFWSGRSRAVRLPKSFRLEAGEVRIRRHGSAVILEPVAHDWAWLDQITGAVDADFVAAANEQPAAQDRPTLDYPSEASARRQRGRVFKRAPRLKVEDWEP